MLSPWLDSSACSRDWGQSPFKPDSNQSVTASAQALTAKFLSGFEQSGPRLFIILAPPRSGSFHLCRLLWRLGYGKPTEYLNPNSLYRVLLSRWGTPPRLQRWASRCLRQLPWPSPTWFSLMVRERSALSALSGRPFFGLKLQAFQLPGPLEKVGPRLLQSLVAAGCQSGQPGSSTAPPQWLLLRRRDWRAAVASLHLSRCSACYDLGLIPSAQHHPLHALLNPETLAGTAALFQRHLVWLQQAARWSSPLLLDHEDLLVDQAGQLMRLLRILDPALPAGWQPTEPVRALLAKPVPRDPSPWAQQRRHWLERVRSLLERCISEGTIPLAAETELLRWWMSPAGAEADPSHRRREAAAAAGLLEERSAAGGNDPTSA